MSDTYHPIFIGTCNMLFIAVTSFALMLVFPRCKPETRPAIATDHLRMMDAKLINYNQQVVRTENDEIGDYIARHQWKMLKTSTGLQYMIYEKGKGKKIIKGEKVRFNFKLSLLNGNKIYSSDSLGVRIIYPGTSEGEPGLQEALLLMQYGDRAKLIIPSHLAFGLLGDLKKIPAGATLVYDIEILSQY